jgi:transcriptional repressor OPI1
VARISGAEAVTRWALQPKKDGKSPAKTPDVEKGLADVAPNGIHRTNSDVTYTETLPAYSAGDRSPPYSEHQALLQRDRQPPPGWRQQLMVSTSGLGIAMSDESIKSLKYCLNLLRWANGHLSEAIQNLKYLLERWNEGLTPGDQPHTMSVANMTQTSDERRQAALSARIATLKADVLQTLKTVVNIVSNYAGGALPQNARELVHRHLISLPQRFNLASMAGPEDSSRNNGSEAAKSGRRVMVLAQEGLDMMTQVSRVVNDTLSSAESWCEKLGRRRNGQSSQALIAAADEKMEIESATMQRSESLRSETLPLSSAGEKEGADVKMTM